MQSTGRMLGVTSSLVGIVCASLALSALSAQEPGSAEKPAAKEKAASKAGVTVPWQGQNLGKLKALNRMRLQKQNGKWEGLETLSLASLEVGKSTGDKDLLAYGNWYRALLSARVAQTPDDSKAREAMAYLKDAVQNGFENADDMQKDAALAMLQERQDLKTMIQDLSQELDRRMKSAFRTRIDAALAGDLASLPAWQPGLLGSDGKPLFTPGKPSVLIVSRIHHDGFPKVLALLKAFAAKYPLAASPAVVFYQYDATDAARKAQTVKYVEGLKAMPATDLQYSWATVGRDPFHELSRTLATRAVSLAKKPAVESATTSPTSVSSYNYFPMMVLVGPSGAPLCAIEGVPTDWQLDYLFPKFQELTPKAEAAPPKEEAAPKDEAPKPADPAPTPEPAPAPEPTPAPEAPPSAEPK